jgi:hypothetical protein
LPDLKLRDHPPYATEILLNGVSIGTVFSNVDGTYLGILTLEGMMGTAHYPTLEAAIEGIIAEYDKAPAKYKER